MSSKRQTIYQYIRENQFASKQDIVVGLQYSLPTITRNLKDLEQMELIDTSEKIRNTGGRNATAYTYIRNAKQAIGLYLTAHHINCVAVDLSGNVVCMRKIRERFDLRDDRYLKKIAETVEEVKTQAEISDGNLLGVGVALPGLVSEDGETVIYGRTLGFTGEKKDDIVRYIPYRTRLFHDSAVAGYAETWIADDIRNAFYIGLSNSVGGAFIVNNRIYEGNSQKGGEIGHMVVNGGHGEFCYCGNRGCFDTVCRSTKLDEYTDGNLSRFFELLEAGDGQAARMWDEYLENLTYGIQNIRMLFDSDIILGGYVGAYMETYMEDLCARVDRLNPFGDRAKNYLRPCRYKIESAAAGAAIRFVEDFIAKI